MRNFLLSSLSFFIFAYSNLVHANPSDSADSSHSNVPRKIHVLVHYNSLDAIVFRHLDPIIAPDYNRYEFLGSGTTEIDGVWNDGIEEIDIGLDVNKIVPPDPVVIPIKENAACAKLGRQAIELHRGLEIESYIAVLPGAAYKACYAPSELLSCKML